jgi:hypothetical protein
METVVFRNRMGGSNLLWIAFAFALAGAWLIFTGTDVLLTLGIVAALVVASYAMVAVIIAMSARRQIAELRETPAGLWVEMVHLFGKGRQFTLAPDQVQGWTLTGARTKYATLHLKTADQGYKLPLYGAKVVDRDSLLRLAGPEIVATLDNQRAFTAR